MEEIEITAVKLDTQPAETSVKELRKQLKELKDQMAGLEEGGDAFLECATKAGELQHQLQEINECVKGASADFGDMLGNVTKATTGIIGGFQAANAALDLFGVESEEVTIAIKKMQDSMAIVQGLDSIDQGIKALAKLRHAITGTTTVAKILKTVLQPKAIIALTAAIAVAVALFNKLRKNVKDTFDAFKGINEETKNNVTDVSKQITQIELLKSVINNENATLKEKQAALNELNRLIPQYNGYIDETTGKVIASTEAEDKYVESLLNEARAQAVVKQTEALMEKKLQYQVELQQKQKDLADANAKLLDDMFNLNSANGSTAQQVFSDAVAQSKIAVSDIEKEVAELNGKIEDTENDIQNVANAASKLITVESLIKTVTTENKQEKKTTVDPDKVFEEYITLEKAKAKATISIETDLNTRLLEIENERVQHYKEGTVEYYNALVNVHELEKKLAEDNKTEVDYDEELTQLERTNTEELALLQVRLHNKEITLEEFNTRAKEINATYKQDYIDTLQYLLEQDTLSVEQRAALYSKLQQATQPVEEENKLSAEDQELQKLLIDYSLIEQTQWEHLVTMQNQLDEGLHKQLISEETYVKASKKLAKEKADYQINCTATALNGVADILNSLASMEDTNNKEGFERSKKLQIAAATIQMLTGITSALAGAFTTHTGPWDIALAAIQAATIAASGAANISNISKQTYDGDNASSALSTASTSASSVSSIIAPVQYTQDIQGANIEETLKDTRVYVTEYDISKTQKKVNVAESEAYY